MFSAVVLLKTETKTLNTVAIADVTVWHMIFKILFPKLNGISKIFAIWYFSQLWGSK